MVNCLGPGSVYSVPVARCALAHGVAYVDPAGGPELLDDLRHQAPDSWTAILDAGIRPGLTGLLVRWAAAQCARPIALRLWHGGLVPLSRGSAIDILMLGGSDFGATGCVRRSFAQVRAGGADTLQVPRILESGGQGRLFLSMELARICDVLGVPDADEAHVVVGRRLAAVADSYAGAAVRAWDAQRRDEAVQRLQSAVLADLSGRAPHYAIVVEAQGGPGRRRVCVRTSDPLGLSGVIVALAVRAIAEGHAPLGAHTADEALEADACLQAIRASGGAEVLIGDDDPASAPHELDEGEIV
jgi:hypothetical protein